MAKTPEKWKWDRGALFSHGNKSGNPDAPVKKGNAVIVCPCCHAVFEKSMAAWNRLSKEKKLPYEAIQFDSPRDEDVKPAEPQGEAGGDDLPY